MDPILYLTGLAIVFLIGLLGVHFSDNLRLPHMLLLIIIGLLLSPLKEIFTFSDSFLFTVAMFILISYVFESAMRLDFKEFSDSSERKRVLEYFVVNVILMGLFVLFLFLSTGNISIITVLLALLFAVAVSLTDSSVKLFFKKEDKERKHIEKRINIESLYLSPLSMVLVFLILSIIRIVDISSGDLIHVLLLIFQNIVIGLAVGFVMGILVLKGLRKIYSHHISYIAIVVTAVLSFVVAELLLGNGILAVAVVALFFGNVYLKQKNELLVFKRNLNSFLEIFVFIFLGMVIEIPFTISFLLTSLGLFVVIFVLRYVIISLIHAKNQSKHERLYMSLIMPKGLALAVIIFALIVFNAYFINQISALLFAILIYSLILSLIAARTLENRKTHKHD